MRELNEQELEQVAGGSFNLNWGTQAQAVGDAGAKWGYASSKSVTNSVHVGGFSKSFAANSSFAIGHDVGVDSSAASTSGLTISA
jgi:hypothetical protein